MATPFERTTRALAADHGRGAAWAWLAAGLLGAAWLAWFRLGRVTLWEVSAQARLEVQQTAHPVAAPLAAALHRSHLQLGRRVQACSKGFQAEVVYANDLTVRELCRKTRRPDACVRENSVLTRLGAEGRDELLAPSRERRAAGVDPRPARDQAPTREELAQRRAEERERNERIEAAATPQERQRVRAEYAERQRERQAARKAERADERQQQQACELSS